eukprot:PLAT11972.1.p1 GENE.PLAT11972.1~~PLAT11972.1.p1  ORF type:complete len:407 (-),score=231.98 PLAT11972.1:78-1277(-)
MKYGSLLAGVSAAAVLALLLRKDKGGSGDGDDGAKKSDDAAAAGSAAAAVTPGAAPAAVAASSLAPGGKMSLEAVQQVLGELMLTMRQLRAQMMVPKTEQQAAMVEQLAVQAVVGVLKRHGVTLPQLHDGLDTYIMEDQSLRAVLTQDTILRTMLRFVPSAPVMTEEQVATVLKRMSEAGAAAEPKAIARGEAEGLTFDVMKYMYHVEMVQEARVEVMEEMAESRAMWELSFMTHMDKPGLQKLQVDLLTVQRAREDAAREAYSPAEAVAKEISDAALSKDELKAVFRRVNAELNVLKSDGFAAAKESVDMTKPDAIATLQARVQAAIEERRLAGIAACGTTAAAVDAAWEAFKEDEEVKKMKPETEIRVIRRGGAPPAAADGGGGGGAVGGGRGALDG